MDTARTDIDIDAGAEPAPKRSAAVFLLGAVVCFVIPPLAAGTLVEQPPGPANLPDTASILVAAAVYIWLFLHTRRLVAPILAHSLWNIAAILTVVVLYG